MRFRQAAAGALLTPLLIAIACSSPSPTSGGSSAPPAPAQPPPAASPAPAADPAPPPPPERDVTPAPSPYEALPANIRDVLDRPFTGDVDEMVKRRLIRAGVVFNRTQYFIDHGTQRGFVYDSLVHFEEALNRRLKTGNLKVHVAFVPLQRDQLFKALNDGKVDLVAAAVTVTPEREKLASFSNPTRTGVSEVVVGSKNAPPVRTAEELSGREVFVRKSSSYYESLTALNRKLAAQGRPGVVIKEAPEALEDDDFLEMANAGLVDLTVVDDFVAQFWRQVFTGIRVYEGAAVAAGGTIAVAVRKDNPGLREAINAWIKKFGPRTAFGNLMHNAYLQRADYVTRAADESERKKFLAIVELFRRYSEQYNLDFLLMAAQGYQESRLDQNAKSKVGAIGIMQVMPQTGKQLKVGDIKQLEPNIHAGVKYIRWMEDQYFKDDPMDDLNKALMSFAAYNAGPGRIRQLRQEATSRGLNPNVWFGNVERIASERIGRETVQYVSNIYKYYVAYRLVRERAQARERTKAQGGAPQ
jgi:membrane-bound lytic murein transglycosylase MltF